MFPFNNKKQINTPPLLCWDIFATEFENDIVPNELPVGGYLKQTLVDYPGHISAMVFTQGCNFRCFYCHNPELIHKLERGASEWTVFYKWVKAQKKLLDAVVFSGGEPTLHPQLPKAIKQIKKLGLKVKLDTNGTNPEMLKYLIQHQCVDYIAMDMKHKTQLEHYRTVAGNRFTESMMQKVLESKTILEEDTVDYEFRITALKPIHDEKTLLEICSQVKGKIYLQSFKKEKTLDKVKSDDCSSFSKDELLAVVDRLKSKNVLVR